MLERERSEVARLGQMVDLIEHDGCQASALGAHSGEPLDQRCGRCSCCEQGSRTALLPRRVPTVDDGVLRKALVLRAARPELPSEPRALARMLCASGELASAKGMTENLARKIKEHL